MIRDGSRDKLIGGGQKVKKNNLKTKKRQVQRQLKRQVQRQLKSQVKSQVKRRKLTRRNPTRGGKKQLGGRVVKPAEFYGKSSGRYYSKGSLQLTPEDSAYGKTNAVSFGTTNLGMTETGPNLGPYPNSSGMMTGGSKRKRSRTRRRSRKQKNNRK